MTTDAPQETRPAARLVTNLLNPFAIFTALYVAAAFRLAPPDRVVPLVVAEVLAAGAVAGYVLLLRRRARVSDFWISHRAQRLVPALFLLGAFVGLLAVLPLLGAPPDLFRLTLSMGLASAAVAAVTAFWKASAHCAVAGHAAVAGPLLLGPFGAPFAVALLLVLYARVSPAAHTAAQALAGAAIGVVFAAAALP